MIKPRENYNTENPERKNNKTRNQEKKVGPEYPGEGAVKTSAAGPYLECFLFVKIAFLKNHRQREQLPKFGR